MALARTAGRPGRRPGAGARGGEEVTAADGSLVVKDLRVEFDGFVAVDGVSFDAHPGEVRFLIGPNGAGKTTCIDAITGLSKGTGSVTLGDQELLGRSTQKIVRLGVGRTFQTASVFEQLSVLQNLDIAAGLHRSSLSLLRARRGVDPAIEVALEETGLSERAGDARRHPVPRPEAVAGDRDDARPGAAGAAARRARRRHEPGRAHRHGRAAAAHRAAPHRSRRRARHGFHAPLRLAGHRPAPGQAALARAPWRRCRPTRRCRRSTSARREPRPPRPCSSWPTPPSRRRPQRRMPLTHGEGA